MTNTALLLHNNIAKRVGYGNYRLIIDAIVQKTCPIMTLEVMMVHGEPLIEVGLKNNIEHPCVREICFKHKDPELLEALLTLSKSYDLVLNACCLTIASLTDIKHKVNHLFKWMSQLTPRVLHIEFQGNKFYTPALLDLFCNIKIKECKAVELNFRPCFDYSLDWVDETLYTLGDWVKHSTIEHIKFFGKFSMLELSNSMALNYLITQVQTPLDERGINDESDTEEEEEEDEA